MQTTMLLTEFIAQLQALEAQKPGISCVFNDKEWGLGTPKADVQKIYHSPDDSTLNTINQFEYDIAQEGMERYETTTTEDEWTSYEDRYRKAYESFGGFEKFQKDREAHYKYRQKVVENYKNAIEAVVIAIVE